jgi:hypothetical protein
MKPIKLIVFISALALVSVALIFNVQLRRSSANSAMQTPGAGTYSTKCTPLPQAAVIAGTKTPTPRRDQVVTPAPVIAATPLPISKTTDLAPGLSSEDKTHVFVMHCNGAIELFLVDPQAILPQALPLKSDDVILYVFPPESMMGHQPPPVNNTLPTQSGTPMPLQPPPYPPPGTPYP